MNNFDINKCKIICFYSEKSGVCKTTNAINLAYAFAANGKRVLIYDCDSQRGSSTALLGLSLLDKENVNAASWILSFENDHQTVSPLTYLINRPIKQGYHRTLYDQVIDDAIIPKPCDAFSIAKNIWLVPSTREIERLDKIILLEEFYSLNPLLFHLNQKSGKPYASIIETAKAYNIDFVFLDLNSNKGELNRRLIFSSHYLIVPTEPDYHSSEMISSLRQNLVVWHDELDIIRLNLSKANAPPTDFPLPTFYPKFLGIILNKIYSFNIGEIENGVEFNSYSKRSSLKWIDKIETSANYISLENILIKSDPLKSLQLFKPVELAISKDVYTQCGRSTNLGIVRNFNELKIISEMLNIPISFLDKKHLLNYNNTTWVVQVLMEKVSRFRQVFNEIYETINMLIELDIKN